MPLGWADDKWVSYLRLKSDIGVSDDLIICAVISKQFGLRSKFVKVWTKWTVRKDIRNDKTESISIVVLRRCVRHYCKKLHSFLYNTARWRELLNVGSNFSENIYINEVCLAKFEFFIII